MIAGDVKFAALEISVSYSDCAVREKRHAQRNEQSGSYIARFQLVSFDNHLVSASNRIMTYQAGCTLYDTDRLESSNAVTV